MNCSCIDELPKRIAKRVKPRNVWVRDLFQGHPDIGSNLDYSRDFLRLQSPGGNLCSVCKGSKMLCGKTSCPVIARAVSHHNVWRSVGGLSVDGSFTNCKFGAASSARAIYSLVQGTHCTISGQLESGGLGWYFKSAQITSMDVTLGDSDTIIEASFDWTVLQPYDVVYENSLIKDF